MICKRLALVAFIAAFATQLFAAGSMTHRFDSEDVRVVLEGWWRGTGDITARYDFDGYEIDLLADVGILRSRDLIEAMDTGTTDLDLQHKIGRLLLTGGGRVSASPTQAHEWLTRAASRGHAEAQNDLASLYLVGKGTPQNFDRAFNWFSRSARLGSAEGQMGLGLCHLFGLGTPANATKARWNLEKATGQRLHTAQLVLAFQRLVGGIVEFDERKAYELLSLAYVDGGPALLGRSGLDVLQAELLRRLSVNDIRFSQTRSNFDHQKVRNEEVIVIGPDE